MKVSRRFTREGANPYEEFKFVERSSEIKNPDGTVVFKMDGFKAPESLSQVAVDVLVQKYFRKAGVQLVDEQGNPVLDKAAPAAPEGPPGLHCPQGPVS